MASSWISMPPEIRLSILECIIPQYGLEETTSDRGFPPASLLTTVCKEWQDFFEKETFSAMDLEATDLSTFSTTILGENSLRLNYISRVLLTIKLAAYTPCIADTPEGATTFTQNNDTFTQAMETLLKTLSSWEGSLEIRCHCPSTEYSLHAGEQILWLLAKTSHNFTQCLLPYDRSINWFWFFARLMEGDRRQDSKLENLAFRTRYLGHRSDQDAVTACLCFIGGEVRHLAALRTVELWDAGDGFGCLFRCTKGHSRLTITWRCTDERFTLEEKVIEQWANLAPNHQLKVRRIPLTKSAKLNKRFKLSTILPSLHLRQLSSDPTCEDNTVKMKVHHRP